jgi:hypothetical protein
MSRRLLEHVWSVAGLSCLLALTVSACEDKTDDPADGGSAGSSGLASSSGSGGTAAQSGSPQGGSFAGGSLGGTSSGASAGGSPTTIGCDSPGLTWKSARKTYYTSYPDPGSPECIEFNGCMWSGLFAACNDKKTEDWVSKHNIVAAFPGYDQLELHDLCLKSGDKTIVVTVLDTCADSDCSGCCTTNQGDNDALIDLESYTNERWGVEDGIIQWADLGPTTGDGCK